MEETHVITNMFVEEIDDIIITIYKKEHYADFVKAGYYLHLHDYLKPDVCGRIKEFANKTLFRNKEEIKLISYSKKDMKAARARGFLYTAILLDLNRYLWSRKMGNETWETKHGGIGS